MIGEPGVGKTAVVEGLAQRILKVNCDASSITIGILISLTDFLRDKVFPEPDLPMTSMLFFTKYVQFILRNSEIGIFVIML